jgi:DNA-binding LytR/AlgR family response regulator
MNCIIFGDKISSKLLEEFVGKTTSLNLIGTFNDSVSVKDQLSKRQDIDLIFLDLEVLKTDIFDFISSLSYQPNIIMVSSSEQNALKAFDFNAVDYLIKPVTYSRFCNAVNKANKFYSRKEVRNRADNEIFIKKGSVLVKLKLKDIVYIEALENYVTLNTSEGKFTIHFTMKSIENQLPSKIFFRVHRSFIVNKSMIKTIKENSLELIIGNEVKNIPISSSFRDPLLNSINMIAK